MRTAFLKTIEELAGDDSSINLVVGDLGFTVIEPFREKYPNQFLNAGVAEQNMAGLACGMALEGKKVFIYSIANFPTLRCIEQIRNDGCYHEANLKIVSVGGGFSYGALGSSHHATEDLAVLRSLPNMVVLAPGDPVEVEHATRATVEHNGPCYLRLGKAGEPIVHEGKIDFQLGKALKVRDGEDLTIASTGSMLYTSSLVCDELEKLGISTRLLSYHTLKPLDGNAILNAARETRAILSVEEHSVIGGLGGALAEVLAQDPSPNKVPFKIIGIPDRFTRDVGSQDYLKKINGLTVEDITTQAQEILQVAGAMRA